MIYRTLNTLTTMTGFLTFIGGFAAGLVAHSLLLLLLHRIEDDDDRHTDYDESAL